jgi:2'-5' RNA ligase
MIFPKFHNIQKIEELRKLYDPLINHVHPHVTLVFPFKSDLSEVELKEHLKKSLVGIKPFKLKLQGISGEEGGYLFLNVIEGDDQLVELHNRFYEGILQQYYPEYLTTEYKPHMTVGRFSNQKELMEVVDKYKSMNESFEELVKEISVEIIDENENSIIEMTLELEDDFVCGGSVND